MDVLRICPRCGIEKGPDEFFRYGGAACQDCWGRGRKKKTPVNLFEEEVETGDEDLVARFRALRGVAEALVAGALGNLAIREYIAAGWMTEVGQRVCPTVRVEFEHTRVIGKVGEGLEAGRHKNWGGVLGVYPLEPEDPVDPMRVLYLFKEGNPYQRRFDQRRAMRAALGPGFSRLVNAAYRSRRGDFLAGLGEGGEAAIRAKLKVDGIVFWRAARGKLTLRSLPRQTMLFQGELAEDSPPTEIGRDGETPGTGATTPGIAP